MKPPKKLSGRPQFGRIGPIIQMGCGIGLTGFLEQFVFLRSGSQARSSLSGWIAQYLTQGEVRKVLRSGKTSFEYERQVQP